MEIPIKGKIWLAILVFMLWVPNAHAVVIKKLRIESNPSGAEVFLRQVTRKVPLGKTPLNYTAEFHSEISILRMTLQKAGYESKTIEVSAKQNKIVVELVSRSLAAAPDSIKDPALRGLQKKLGPKINRKLPKLLETKGSYEYELAEPMRIVKLDGKVYLILNIELRGLKKKSGTAGKNKNEAFLHEVWRQFGRGMVIPLAKAFRGERSLNGVILDVNYSQIRRGFGVSSHVEERMEMECVPGTVMKRVYQPCARRRTEYYTDSYGNMRTRMGGCEGDWVMQSVYDPCAYRAPVTKRKVKVDPRAITRKGQLRAQFVLLLKMSDLVDQQLYSKLGILLTDEKGKSVIKRGVVPSTLPVIPY